MHTKIRPNYELSPGRGIRLRLLVLLPVWPLLSCTIVRGVRSKKKRHREQILIHEYWARLRRKIKIESRLIAWTKGICGPEFDTSPEQKWKIGTKTWALLHEWAAVNFDDFVFCAVWLRIIHRLWIRRDFFRDAIRSIFNSRFYIPTWYHLAYSVAVCYEISRPAIYNQFKLLGLV